MMKAQSFSKITSIRQQSIAKGRFCWKEGKWEKIKLRKPMNKLGLKQTDP
jgi:hypothetical protein